MVDGESGVATDLARAVFIPTVNVVVAMVGEFKDVNVAAVLVAFREARYAKLESDLERDKDACEMLASRAVGECRGVATEDVEEEVLVVLDHWETPPKVFRDIQELPDGDRTDP